MKVSFKTVYRDGSHSSHVGEIESICPEIIRGQLWYQFYCEILIRRSGDSTHFTFDTSDRSVIITRRQLRTYMRIFLYCLEGKVRCKLAELLHLPMLLYPLFTANDFWIESERPDPDDPDICSGEFRQNFLRYLMNISTEEKTVMVASRSDNNIAILPRMHRFDNY